MKVFICVALTLGLTPAVTGLSARAQNHVRQNGMIAAASNCSMLKDDLASQQEDLTHSQTEVAVFQRMISEASAGSEAAAMRMFNKYRERVRLDRHYGAGNQYQRDLWGADEGALEHWRNRVAELRAGDIFKIGGDESYVSALRARISQKQIEIQHQKWGLSELRRKIDACENQPLNLSGSFTCEGPHCGKGTATVTQAGQNLIFTNESGMTSKGRFLSKYSVIADDWEGGLHGEVSADGRTITWSNGSVWTRH